MADNNLTKILLLLQVFILGLVNWWVFGFYLKLSWTSSYYGLFITLSLFYILFTLLPPLLVWALLRNRSWLLFLLTPVALFLIPIYMGQVVESLRTKPTSQPKEISRDVYLELNDIQTVEGLRSIPFCFKVYLPTYVPMQLKFVAAGSSKDCDKQILVVDYGLAEFVIIEIPKGYDFSFRSGFEELDGLRKKALIGSSLVIAEKKGFLARLDNITEGLVPPSVANQGTLTLSKAQLLYWEAGDTLIFLKFRDGLSLKEALSIAISMKPL